ncbi:MAG: ABC transporter permease [Planctomycetes bacterium]|nr:ABC transporter permease [Planctomycetota bacterium]
MSTFFADLRFAIRQLRRDPWFALVAILTLGVGIGATTVIFSVFNGTVLRELPYPDSEHLVRLSEVSPQGHVFSLSEPNFLDLQERTRSFSRLVAVSYKPMTVADEDESLRVIGVFTTEGLFEMLGVAPTLGRAFSSADFISGTEAEAVIIGHGLWESRFGTDPSVLGRTVELDGTVRTIVGVMPRGFDFPYHADAWLPFVADPSADRAEHVLESFGRLAPGVSLDLAAADAGGIAAQLGDEFPRSNREWGVSLVTFRDWQIGPRATRIAIVLLGAVGLLLLLACASVSNLLLARTASRQREIALRATLGALRQRLLGQMIVESLVLAVLSAGVGLLFTAWVLPIIQALETDALPRLNEVTIDHTVVLFTVLVTVTTGFICGAAPAFQASNDDLEVALRGGERIVAGDSRMVREVLVTCQLALAVVLLVGAGLLANSFVRMLDVDPGFDAESILAVEISVPEDRYPQLSPLVSNFYQKALERIEAIPRVKAAGASMVSPLSISRPSNFVGIEGSAETQSDLVPIQWRAVTPGFFEAIGSRLLGGRFFDVRESSSEASPFFSNVADPSFNAVISESLAGRLWPNGDAVGQQLVWSAPDGPTVTVVGVVADLRDVTFPTDPRPTVFLPLSVAPMPTMTILVNVSGDPSSVATEVRDAIWAVDANIPVPPMRSLHEAIEAASISGPRLNAVLVGLFAAAALGLAALGIYGVTAFSVARRKREIGVRMALGAEPSRIVGIALTSGTKLILLGTGVGLVCAFGLSHFLGSMLYEIRPSDPFTYAVVTLVLVGVATVANYLPARRATKIDPRVAFTSE